jgi:hypothetical protein
VTRERFRQRFEDTWGYFPLNSAETDRYPLRWKPLVQAIDGLGRFAIQVYILPHLGAGRISCLIMTREQLEKGRAPSPYEHPNMGGKMSSEDVTTVNVLIDDLLTIHPPALRRSIC